MTVLNARVNINSAVAASVDPLRAWQRRPVNIGVLGTPKCGHAFITSLLQDIYVCHGVGNDWMLGNVHDMTKYPLGVLFNAHHMPARAFDELFSRIGLHAIAPIRHPLDCLISLLSFYRRLPRASLTPAQIELIATDQLINDAVRRWVLGGSFEGWYVNSYLWHDTGAQLVRYEDLVRRPLDVLRAVCDRIAPVPDRVILGAYYANQLDLFRRVPGNSVHVNSSHTRRHQSYDPDLIATTNAAARDVVDYIRMSPACEPYLSTCIAESLPHCTIDLSASESVTLRRLYFLSRVFSDSTDDDAGFERYLDQAYAPVDSKRPIVPYVGLQIWFRRLDLRAAFAEPLGRDRHGFLSWLLTQGCVEYDLPTSVFKSCYTGLVNS
jgi:hypothetical protein